MLEAEGLGCMLDVMGGFAGGLGACQVFEVLEAEFGWLSMMGD
jgi:hypothetical protein